tara:strand:+ start:103 stop:1137 length:1035 start_codon:yes stop_codon:yes gene_type:complete
MSRSKNFTFKIFIIISLAFGDEYYSIQGDIVQLNHIDVRTCPDVVDSCIYICSNAITNPCHPENIYTIAIDTIAGSADSDGSRYRIYFPWEYNGMYADKFKVTASWPCLSPTAVAAIGNYAFWDIIGNDACPGTVQGSIWYGDDCEDSEGNIGAEHCSELVGRFCFAPGDTLDWPEIADQSIWNDNCNVCWMSLPAWNYYDTYQYSDSLLFPGSCDYFDHCHHGTPANILCGVGYYDGNDSSTIDIIQNPSLFSYNLYDAYPNPFNPVTILRYDLPEETMVKITILNMMGRKINTLASSQQSAGHKSIRWNGTNDKGAPVSAGLYLYKIEAGQFRQTKKMILLK